MKNDKEQWLAIHAEIAKLNMKIERGMKDIDCELRKISTMSFFIIILFGLYCLFQ